MKTKTLLYAFVPALLSLSLVGGGIASAHSGNDARLGFGFTFEHSLAVRDPATFATQADAQFKLYASILGASVDEVKAAWADGKGILELAKDKGLKPADVKAKLAEARKVEFKAMLKVLVDKGVITQAQADARLKLMDKKLTSPVNQKGGKHLGQKKH